MSSLPLHRICKRLITKYSRLSFSKPSTNRLSSIPLQSQLLPSQSHASFASFDKEKSQQNPLYTSYAQIKAHSASEQAKKPQLSSNTPSPLLSHLDLIDPSTNTLKQIDWKNWDSLRKLFDKTNLYYINDFCNEFSYQHSGNKIISNDFIKRTQYMLIKTNMGGKNNRGLLHCISLMLLRKQQNKTLTPSDVHNALTIALCIEALQSFFLVMDDIVDQSTTRRGQPCWYRFPNVGLKVYININILNVQNINNYDVLCII